MSLLSSIINSANALNVHSKGTEIAGRNIANVNNPNYARQHLVIDDKGTVGTKSQFLDLGIEITDVRNVRNSVIDSQLIREKMDGGSLEAQSQFLRTMESLLGEELNRAFDTADSIQSPDSLLSPSGLSNSIDSFFNAFEEVAANPTDESQKAVLLQKAAVLAERFHTIDSSLTQLDTDIDDEIDATVIEANQSLDYITELNSEITRFERINDRTALELRDKRQGELEKLAEIMNFETRQLTTSTGHLQVFVRDGANNEVLLVDGLSKESDISYDGTNYSAGSPSVNVSLTGGRLEGLQTVRSGALTDLQTQLDDMAANMVSNVNTAYNPLSTVGEDFFDAANVTAGDISVVSTLNSGNFKTTNSGNAGDNELALAVANVASINIAFATGYTGDFNGYISKITTDVGTAVNTVAIQEENQDVVERMLLAERDSVSGVNMDEEITDMMRFQRAFQASARVITTMDNLLDTVVNGLVR